MRTYFGTDGIRGTANKHPMTVETAMKTGQAVAYLFKNKGKKHKKILIGKDTRLSCYMLENALAAGISSMGVDVLLVGPMPTPAISFLTTSMRADAGIVISASHNPYYDNGIKIFASDGFKLPDEQELSIEKLMDSSHMLSKRPTGKDIGKAWRIDDALGRYIVFLKQTFPKNMTLDGVKIVLDCANGATYKVAPLVFEELGADVIKLNVSPNGLNINDNCGALFPDNLKKIVLETEANMGIALDGDGDRVIVVDEKGNQVDGDHIMAICCEDLLKQGKLNRNTLVATVMSNMGLEVAMEGLGCKLMRTKVGDRYVVEAMREGNYNFGGEQSGHLIFLDHITTGDGILSSLQLLSVMLRTGTPLSELSQIMSTFPQVLLNVRVKEKRNTDEIPGLKEFEQKMVSELRGKGRILIRPSGTEPVIRVMVEGEKENKISSIASDLCQYIEKACG
jgi:phosphoglucosamine mutase